MLCRICLQSFGKAFNEQMIDLFNEVYARENIPDIISKYFWFRPNVDDVSKVMCRECWHKILDFHHFYLYVKKNHDDYLLQINNNKSGSTSNNNNNKISNNSNNNSNLSNTNSNCNSIRNKNVEDVKRNAQKALKDVGKVEDTGDNLNIKIKEEDEMESILQIDKDLCCNNDECSDEVNPLESVKFENFLNSSDNSSEDNDMIKQIYKKVTNKRRVIKKKQNQSKANNEIKKRKTATTAPLNEKHIRRTTNKYDPQLIETLIRKHIRMVCDLCVYIGETFSDIVQHFTMEHPGERPYVICCERKLSRRYLLNQHALKHENPDFFRCHDCQKSFVDSNGLRAHILLHHAKEEEKTHACEFCPRKFARKLFLELHKRTHIPQAERTFICTECSTPKGFATQYLLQIHYNMKHKRDGNVCHICAKTFSDKRRFEKHVRSHSGDSGPRLKCTQPGCNSWLKDLDNLRQHLKDHNTEGKIYQCGQCGKTCKNSRSLTNHKRNNHSNEIYKCEECNKTFKRPITLKEHMAQHTGETLYNCPFCTRTFNSNANMHSHKKKMHPVEWNEWRQRKCGILTEA